MEKFLTIRKPIVGNEDYIYHIVDISTVSGTPQEGVLYFDGTQYVVYRSGISDGYATIYSALIGFNAREDVVFEHNGAYYRRFSNNVSRIYDVEFPKLGVPFELYDFEYSAQRMSVAATISATAMYPDFLDEEWTLDCFVEFNGERLYLKQVPTSSKNNEDARYKYQMDFISEREVLENVYFYDVVSPFIGEAPISQNTKVTFFGDIKMLAQRVNKSLVYSGLSHYVRQNQSPYLSYSEWNEIGLGNDSDTDHNNTYNRYGGNYSLYLQGEVFVFTDDEAEISGFKVVIGNDAEGNPLSSEEKLLTFERNRIHEVLQAINDEFELQYYITKERASDGSFTGNTLIVIGDSEYDFGQDDAFEYGVDEELLSIEKTNTNDKIVTRCTGIGSSENIPWYYPNPTPDGWIEPVYKRDGEVQNNEIVEHEVEFLNNGDFNPYWDRYLKNRLGFTFKWGNLVQTNHKWDYTSESSLDGTVVTLKYYFEVLYPSYSFDYFCKWNFDCWGPFFISVSSEMTHEDPGSLFPTIQTGLFSFENYVTSGQYNITFKIYLRDRYIPSTTNPGGITGALYYYPIRTFKYDVERILGIEIGAKLGVFGGFFSHERDMVFLQGASTNACGWYYNDGNGNWRKATEYNGKLIFAKLEETYYAYPVEKTSVFNSRINTQSHQNIVSNIMHRYEYMPPLCKTVTELYSTRYTSRSGLRSDTIPLVASNIKEFNGLDDYVTKYVDFTLSLYHTDGWYLDNKKVVLDDYGITNEAELSHIDAFGRSSNTVHDTIEFRRVKYLTPQPNLMPSNYYLTDGQNRFFNAYNYDPVRGTYPVDRTIGERFDIQRGGIINPIYSEDDTGNEHYVFENIYDPHRPYEHIEEFEDIKPTIKGQKNSSQMRIDVVEEFAYDMLDEDGIWEDNDNGNTEGEYKHPHFFAKLRPMGFNIFDLALTDDMVISMTNGACGSCQFKIKVDENSKKNPVQIWAEDVGTFVGGVFTLKRQKGELKRYEDFTEWYYRTFSSDGSPIYTPVNEPAYETGWFSYGEKSYKPRLYTSEQVTNQEVGVLNLENNLHFEGDVVTSGRFIDEQQDTTNNYVWVALEKDTSTYGVVMPSAQPNYNSRYADVFIRPKSYQEVYDNAPISVRANTNEHIEYAEENADNFVLTNIRLPIIYLRRAERELSREIVKYMYEHNYFKFNFSIGFSRIFMEQNPNVLNRLNENSVLYVRYVNQTKYRQYVASYSYKMSADNPLPEIKVDMNKDLSVIRNGVERNRYEANLMRRSIGINFNNMVRSNNARYNRLIVWRNSQTVVNGNIISNAGNISGSIPELTEIVNSQN